MAERERAEKHTSDKPEEEVNALLNKRQIYIKSETKDTLENVGTHTKSVEKKSTADVNHPLQSMNLEDAEMSQIENAQEAIHASFPENQQIREPESQVPVSDGITVTFEVLLHSSFGNAETDNIGIVFGPPVSDWKSLMVQMKKKKNCFKNNDYTYLTGETILENYRDPIPYSYISVKNSKENTEFIFLNSSEPIDAKRCLEIPQAAHNSFVKYDDVIFDEESSSKEYLQAKGREIATKWMLPQPDEITETIDFQSLLEKVDTVIHTHLSPKVFNPTLKKPINFKLENYKNKVSLKEYFENIFSNLETHVRNKFHSEIWKTAVYLTLLGSKPEFEINQEVHFKQLFNAFKDVGKFLCTVSQQESSKIAAALKKFVNDFLAFKTKPNNSDQQGFGDWIFVIPLIHHLKPCSDQWLQNLTVWQEKWSKLHTKGRILNYLDFVNEFCQIDPQLKKIFCKMLSKNDIEDVLTGEMNQLQIFDALDLVVFLLKMARCPRQEQVRKACKNVLQCCKEKITLIKTTKSSDPGNFLEKDLTKLQLIQNEIKNRSMSVEQTICNEVIICFLQILTTIKTVGEVDINLVKSIRKGFKSDFKKPQTNQIELAKICLFCDRAIKEFKILDGKSSNKLIKLVEEHTKGRAATDCLKTFEENFSKEIADIILKRALTVFTEESRSIRDLFSTNNFKNVKNLTILLEESLKKLEMDKEKFAKDLIQFPAHTVIIMRYLNLAIDHQHSELSQRTLKYITQIGQISQDLETGNISLDFLAFLKEKNFCSLYNFYHKARFNQEVDDTSIKKLQNLLFMREKDRKDFIQAISDLQIFCSYFKDQINPKVLQLLKDLFQCPKNQTLSLVSHPKKNPGDKLKVNILCLTSEDLTIIEEFGWKYEESSIFRLLHDQALNTYSTSSAAPIDNICSAIDLSKQVIQDFEKFVTSLSSLDIRIKTVLDSFQKIIQEDGKLNQEMNFLCKCSKYQEWCVTVEKSVEMLFKIPQYQEKASAVKHAHMLLNIAKPFQSIEIIFASSSKEDFNQQKLATINQEIIEVGEFFDSWTNNHLEMLKCLEKSKNILNWVRENINGSRELKVFVDLANIHAGETDEEVDTIMHFHSAMVGFAPLILDLDVQNCSTLDFLKACNSVHDAFQRDEHLFIKLLDTSNRKLNQIMLIKDQQGSVEQSSLSLLENINQTGQYTIQSKIRGNEKLSGLKSRSLDTCIKLTYKQEEKNKELCLEKVQELRSKLVLISTKRHKKLEDIKTKVERFIHILGQVEFTAQQLVKLLNSGCHLFSQWKLDVYCDTGKKVKVQADFGHLACGLQHGEKDVQVELEMVGDFLKV
jgi:hypothetical protein